MSLKRAFFKMSVGKIVNRPLLNNFIKMAAAMTDLPNRVRTYT